MKKLFLTSALALTLTGCVVSGHPSTDKHHSHVDTSSTRYDVYDPNYDYKDKTKHRNKQRLYEDFEDEKYDNNVYIIDDSDDYYEEDGLYNRRYDRTYYKYGR